MATLGSLKDDIRAQLEAQGTTFTEWEVDAAFNVGIALGVLRPDRCRAAVVFLYRPASSAFYEMASRLKR